MHTYRRYKASKNISIDWQVGYWTPKKKWETIRTFGNEIQAISLVNFLNGGDMTGIDIIAELLDKVDNEKPKPVTDLIGKKIEIDK